MMKKLILKQNGIETHNMVFDSSEAAQVWLNSIPNKNAFGNKQRWIEESKATNQEIASAIDTAEIPNPTPGSGPATFTMLLLPATFEHEIVDITSQIEANEMDQESLEAISLGVELMAKIRSLNKKKISDGTLTTQQFIAMLADENMFAIERAIWNGSFDTAKTLIQNLNQYYSSDEKSPILSKINAFLTKYP